MSDEHDPEQKTEPASPRRLDKLFEEGRLPLGRDVAALGALAAALGALFALSGQLLPALVDSVTAPLHSLGTAAPPPLPYKVLALALAVCAAAAVGGAVPLLAQTQGRLWPNLAVPDPSRLWKPGHLTRLFTREGLADLGAAALKALVFALACRHAFDRVWAPAAQLLGSPHEELVSSWATLARPVLLELLGALAVVGALDLALARWKFARDTRMTREEAKREQREDEGDPLLKGQRKKRARQLSKQRLAIDVPKADAVVVNPTHIAVAIRYRKDEGGAPRVIAKGKGVLAENVRELARANGIPIIEDIPLARLLYKRVRVGGLIPAETYKAVATVLAHVYRLKARA